MKKNSKNYNYTNGYIEGFYGRLLTWEERKLLIQSINKNNMNTYFYAPKEDNNHRLNWREDYNSKWYKNFEEFINFSKKYNVNVIVGIAPGLDFDFKSFNNSQKKTINVSDFDVPLRKSKLLLKHGAHSIALMLDDIPSQYQQDNLNLLSEGMAHGVLANKLMEKLGKDIYFVPRIYADELIKEEPHYLKDLGKCLSNRIKVFYCGKNVVSKNLTSYKKIYKILNNEIIFWDNFYANDYCPRRLFLGPFTGRRDLNNIMINATGQINTDLLILEIVKNTINEKKPDKKWLKTLGNHNVPMIFSRIKKYFLKPNFNINPTFNKYSNKSKDIEVIEFLLWKWKSDLAREWYPYLFGLKHDMLINEGCLSSERLIKTQTLPLVLTLKKIPKGELP